MSLSSNDTYTISPTDNVLSCLGNPQTAHTLKNCVSVASFASAIASKIGTLLLWLLLSFYIDLNSASPNLVRDNVVLYPELSTLSTFFVTI